MDNQALAAYAEKVPFVVKAGIEGLADDNRLGMAVALMEEGKMTFSELEAKFGLDPDTLRRYLIALQRGILCATIARIGSTVVHTRTMKRPTCPPRCSMRSLSPRTMRKGARGAPTRPHSSGVAGRGGPDSDA